MLRLLKLWKVSVDLSILLVLALPICYFKFFGVHVQRGLYCDDDSIRYPYQSSTIPSSINYLVGFSLAFFVISVIEGNRILLRPRLELLVDNPENPIFTKRRKFLDRFYRYFAYFLFGFCINLLLTYIGKFGVGRLRPHFLSVCQPNATLINICNQQQHQYVYPVHCEGEDLEKIEEARDSFPSGHSSFSFYCAVFLVLYLQARVHWHFSRLFLGFVQFVCVMLALIVALSRIADYKHHASDVAVGSILGSTVAYMVTVHIGKFFRAQPKPPIVPLTIEDETLNNDY